MSLLTEVDAALEKLPHGAKLLAAVSGGADSSAMLAAVSFSLEETKRACLFAAHINHGLRPEEECAGDASAVRVLCEKLGVIYRERAAPRGAIEAFARKTGCGIEAAARKFRYEYLAEEARGLGASYILTAHTQDDALETALMRVLRGAGPRGLSLMPQAAPIPFISEPPLNIFRPVLYATRREVLDFLAQRGLSYCTDSTNSDARYLRNRLRLHLIPVLDEFFNGWRKGLLETAAAQSLFSHFIDDELKNKAAFHEITEENTINIENFDNLHPFLREEALFFAADRLLSEGKSIKRKIIREFSRDYTKKAANLGGGVSVRRDNLKNRAGTTRNMQEYQ